jgi:hypothetical protein
MKQEIFTSSYYKLALALKNAGHTFEQAYFMIFNQMPRR